MSVETITTQQDNTLADLIERLGVPAERILANPPPGTATEEDVIRLSEREGRLCELTDGVLVKKPMGRREAALAFWLIRYLAGYLETNDVGIGTGSDGPYRFLPGKIRFPDVAVVRYERISDEKELESPIAPWVPDLAVEIISRSNTKMEMCEKLNLYFKHGVKLVWYVEPRLRTVRVYTSPTEMRELTEKDTLDGGDILPGFQLSIREWFQRAK